MNSNKKMLFISPCFFDYYKNLIDEFNSRGIKVTWFNDRPSENFITKSLIRINKRVLFRKNNRYFKKICNVCRENVFDYVLVIFGQFLNKKYVSKMKELQPNAKFIYYTWDSLKNFPVINEISGLFDVRYSFDPEDCKNYGFSFLPLYYCNNECEAQIKYLASSILTIKPGKLENYTKVKKMLPKGDIFEYLYIQSKLVFWFYKFKYKNEFSGYKAKDFKYKKISREKTYSIFSQSAIVIDVQMKNQVGLTMRTFETLNLNRKLITTNSSIKNYDFYDDNNIFVVNDNVKEIPKSFFENEFKRNYIINEYSIVKFVDKLLKED